jgi:hypothetical protein
MCPTLPSRLTKALPLQLENANVFTSFFQGPQTTKYVHLNPDWPITNESADARSLATMATNTSTYKLNRSSHHQLSQA